MHACTCVRFRCAGELEALHRDRWKDQWAGTGIELDLSAPPTPTPTQPGHHASEDPPAAPLPLPAAVNASLLALLGAAREDWPYGMAAGGLTQGGNGHVRWGACVHCPFDLTPYFLSLSTRTTTTTSVSVLTYNPRSQNPTYIHTPPHTNADTEVFLLPALLLLNPMRAQALLHYRLARLAAAEAKARGATPPLDGAWFPWESAATGVETAAAAGGDGEEAVDYAGHAVVGGWWWWW
jgi:hypothetical protein